MILETIEDWLASYELARWLSTTRRLAGLWGPVLPLRGVTALVAALGGLLAAVLLSGLALAALASFLTATLALYLILTRVFGISIELLPA
jgi:hypothetical protein